MNVRMKRPFTYDVDGGKGVKRTLPAGWVGEVDDEIGMAAVKAGAAVDIEAEDAPPAPAPKPAPDKK